MSVLFTRRGVPDAGKRASDYAVGESVFLNVNGTPTEFIVVHQGKPSSLYDSSCDGTWLMMKNGYTSQKWDSSDNNYAYSDIHTYLNGTFYGLLDTTSQSAIEQVKIPYYRGTGTNGSVSSGSSGLSTKVFLLSTYEVGLTSITSGSIPTDGACLSYFNGMTHSGRIAYDGGGVAKAWWLRSPDTTSSSYAAVVGVSGSGTCYAITSSQYVRPAFVISKDAKFNSKTNIIL